MGGERPVHAKTPGNPRGVRVCGVLPIAEPLPAVHGPHLPQQESTRRSRPWAPTGGGPEATVCLGGELFRDPLLPGALPRVGFPPWQTTDVRGEAGEGQAPPHTPAAIWAAGGGPGRAPETRLGPGQPLARAGSQSGGWGVWLAEPPVTPPAWSMDAAGAGTGQGAGGWGGQEGGEGRAPLLLDRARSSETSLESHCRRARLGKGLAATGWEEG